MSAHTPGPWQSQHDNDRDGLLTIIGNVDGPDEGRYHYTLICDVVENASATNDEAVANARLIAAAPELLEALDELSRMYAATWDRVDGDLVMMQDHIPKFEAAHAKAQAALAKARGES